MYEVRTKFAIQSVQEKATAAELATEKAASSAAKRANGRRRCSILSSSHISQSKNLFFLSTDEASFFQGAHGAQKAEVGNEIENHSCFGQSVIITFLFVSPHRRRERESASERKSLSFVIISSKPPIWGHAQMTKATLPSHVSSPAKVCYHMSHVKTSNVQGSAIRWSPG